MWTCKWSFQNGGLASTPLHSLLSGSDWPQTVDSMLWTRWAWHGNPIMINVKVAFSAFAIACCTWGSAVSKDKVSFIALSDRKGDWGSCVWKWSPEHGHLHCMWECPGKLYRQSVWVVGEVSPSEKSPQGYLGTFTELLQYKILWHVIHVVAFISPSLLSFVSFFCVGFFVFKLQTLQSKCEELPSCVY